MKPSTLLLLSAVAVLNTGCASLVMGEPEFSCGQPGGVRCASVRDVYYGNTGASGAGTGAVSGAPVSAVTRHPDRWPNSPWVNGPTIDAPQAVRTAPVVMRIKYFQFQDQADDLHMPGYVLTEIEPRRWLVGEEVEAATGRLQPLTAPVRGER